VVAGMVMLAIPGPGVVALLLGVVLVARESLLVARVLDRMELLLLPCFLRFRPWWDRCSHAQRVLLVGAAGVLGVLAAFAAWLWIFR
jgi:hypothetical protein